MDDFSFYTINALSTTKTLLAINKFSMFFAGRSIPRVMANETIAAKVKR